MCFFHKADMCLVIFGSTKSHNLEPSSLWLCLKCLAKIQHVKEGEHSHLHCDGFAHDLKMNAWHNGSLKIEYFRKYTQNSGLVHFQIYIRLSLGILFTSTNTILLLSAYFRNLPNTNIAQAKDTRTVRVAAPFPFPLIIF